MAKKPASTAQNKPKPLVENEALNGSNILPADIHVGDDVTVTLGEIVAAAHQRSGLTVEAWNALDEPARDQLLTAEIDMTKAVIAAAAQESAAGTFNAQQGLPVADGQTLASVSAPSEVSEDVRSAFGADGDHQRGPRVRQEVRYRGRTYSPGEYLPHDIAPAIEDELDDLGAI